MPVFSRPQQNNIKSRKAMPEWRIATHYARIAIRLIIGIVAAVNRKNILLRYSHFIQQQPAHIAIVTLRIFGRYTPFVHPINTHTAPRTGILEFFRPQIEHERGRAASTECYVKNLLRLFLHQTNKVLDESARRFDSCTIDISFHNSQY